ncbi:MAG: tetratricopeptide repeat protein [Saprospiraceae bacterium]
MPKLDAAIFSKIELSTEQEEHLAELKSSVDELITDKADLVQIKTAYEAYIEACFDYNHHENAEEGLNFIHENSATFELNDAETAGLRRRFGVLALSKKETETAKVEFEKALALLQDSTNEEEALRAKLLADLGNIAALNEAFNEAIEYYEAAIEINEENEIDAAAPFNNLGLIYVESQNYDDAADCFEAALEIYQDKEDLAQQEIIHLQLGSIYYAQDNLTDALRNYHYATELQDEDSEKLGKTYVSMVSILLKMGENEKAVDIYEKALPMLTQHSDIEMKAEHYFQIANLYNRYIDDYEKAIQYYQASLDVAKTDDENPEWRDLMVAKLEDSIAVSQEKLNKKNKKKSGLFGRLFGK